MNGKPLAEFDAQVYKVQTLVDGGLRLTLDLPEDAIAQCAALMECKRLEIALRVAVSDTEHHGTEQRR